MEENAGTSEFDLLSPQHELCGKKVDKRKRAIFLNIPWKKKDCSELHTKIKNREKISGLKEKKQKMTKKHNNTQKHFLDKPNNDNLPVPENKKNYFSWQRYRFSQHNLFYCLPITQHNNYIYNVWCLRCLHYRYYYKMDRSHYHCCCWKHCCFRFFSLLHVLWGSFWPLGIQSFCVPWPVCCCLFLKTKNPIFHVASHWIMNESNSCVVWEWMNLSKLNEFLWKGLHLWIFIQSF